MYDAYDRCFDFLGLDVCLIRDTVSNHHRERRVRRVGGSALIETDIPRERRNGHLWRPGRFRYYNIAQLERARG